MFSRKLKVLLSTALLASSLGAFSPSVMAKEKVNFELKEMKKAENSIYLEWEDIGDNYKIIDSYGKVIYKGTDNKLDINNLKEDFKYNYYIVAYDNNNQEIDYIEVKSSTLEKNGGNKVTFSLDAQSSLENINVDSVINSKSVKIDWDDIAGIDTYEVFRNGENLGTVNKSEFEDKKVVLDKEYTYEFVAKKRINDERIAQLKEDLKAQGKELTPENEDELCYDMFTISRTIQPKFTEDEVVDTNKLEEKLLAATYVRNVLNYKTFIPNKYVPNPFPDGSGTYFGGDNRGFGLNEEAVRTKAFVTTEWSSTGTPTTTIAKRIGETHLYNSNYQEIWKGTASSSGITMTKHSDTTTNKAHFTVYHDVGIPYRDMLSPNITYTYTATIYGDGSYSIYLGHDRAPSHELYMNRAGTWKTIHQHANEGFENLWPTAGQHAAVFSG